MKEKTCKYQNVFYELNHQVFMSTCINPVCRHHLTPVSHLVCDECQDKFATDDTDNAIMAAICDEVEVELPHRSEETQVNILETYCFKCSKFDHFAKICTNCSRGVHMPIDEFVKYEHLHCPLELW